MKRIKRESGVFSLKLIAIVFAVSSLQMSARTPSELSVYGGGGYAGFFCQPLSTVSGVSSGGFGADIGGGFTGFVSPTVGFHIGVGLGMYSINTKVNELRTTSLNLVDANGYDFDLYTTLYDYREHHQMFHLSIPVMIHFQSNMDKSSWGRRQSRDLGFYLMTGIKANILLGRKYESEVGNLFNVAYYEQQLNNWAATQKFAGLGLFTEGKKASGTLDFGILALFTIESGVKWRLTDNMFLYTGAYFDYGLIDPSKSSREPTKNYIYPYELSLVPESADKNLNNLSLLSYTDRMNLMTVGVKLRLAFTRTSSPFDCPRGF